MRLVEDCPDRVIRSVEGLDGGPDADGATGEYIGAKAATVNQAAKDALGGEPFQVRTQFAKPPPKALRLANQEAASYQRVEIDAASDDVAPRLRIAEAAVLIEQEVVEHLSLDEREIVALPSFVRWGDGSRLGGVAVTGKAAAGDGLRSFDQSHRSRGYLSCCQCRPADCGLSTTPDGVPKISTAA
jgi:hypothetical protein